MDKFDIPEPKKIAPQLTEEQRQAMAPVDLLVQYVMPKLLDKVNFLEWAVKAEFHSVREAIEDLRSYVDNVNKTASADIVFANDRIAELSARLAEVERGQACGEKPKRVSRKKKTEDKPVVEAEKFESEPRSAGINADISEPVSMLRIADYDPDADRWVPKIINGTEITEATIDMLAAHADAFSLEIASFIYDLSESERKALCDMFPDETKEADVVD